MFSLARTQDEMVCSLTHIHRLELTMELEGIGTIFPTLAVRYYE